MKIKSFLPIFPGFYNTILEPSEDYYIEDGKTYDSYNWDNAGYELQVCKSCVYAIERKLIELGFNLSIRFEYQYSPKEYNFSNDSINAEFNLKAGCIKAIKKYLITHAAQYAVYLARYKSCSGFISYYSSDVYEWMKFINFKSLANNQHYLGSFFDFILQNEDYDTLELYYDTIDRDGISIEGELIEGDIDLQFDCLGNIIELPEIEVFNPNQLVLQFNKAV